VAYRVPTTKPFTIPLMALLLNEREFSAIPCYARDAQPLGHHPVALDDDLHMYGVPGSTSFTYGPDRQEQITKFVSVVRAMLCGTCWPGGSGCLCGTGWPVHIFCLLHGIG
jgi:hypothetical protein